MQQSQKFEELLDKRLISQVNKEEVDRLVKVALLCTNASPSLRPAMSEVVSMLEGQMTIPDVIPEARTSAQDLRFKAMRDFHRKNQSQSLTESQTLNSTTIQTDMGSSSTSNADLFEINPDKLSH